MDERPIEQLTLRELFSQAEMLVRELNEHLEQSFTPKVRAIEEMVRAHRHPEEASQIADSSVRSSVATLLGSDDFSQRLLSKLERFLVAIDDGAQKAIHEQ